jgi:uncharacterized protein YbjT (DUF2867 family)
MHARLACVSGRSDAILHGALFLELEPEEASMATQQKTTLILGGTGKTGRRVAKRLMERGRPVRIASRSGTPPFDWSDRRTWAPMLRAAESVYLAYAPDLAAPGAAEDVGEITRMAVESGVKRMVLLSGRGEPQAVVSEQPVRNSGLSFTVLRCSFFCQNFSEGVMLESVRSGAVPFPAGNVAEPFIDAEDIAEVAVAALTEEGHAGKTYELTGPRLLTFGEAVGEIARASGREVRYLPVTHEAYGAALAEQLPPEVATFLSELFRDLLDGHNAYLTDGVEKVLGRKPRDFHEFARDAAASGAWS